MTYFSKRLLMYGTSANKNNLDYGSVSQIITDKSINVDMGGSDYILEAVSVEGNYIPKIGDWVVIEWQNGNPVAKGSNTAGGGLQNINTPTIISTSDLASGVINSDHIRTNTIEAQHISAYAVEAQHISANSVTAIAISANSIQTQHISANTITGQQIQANTITSDNIKAGSISATSMSANSISAVNIQAGSITSALISANAVQTQHISANTIQANQIQANQVNATHISANSISAPTIQANAIQTQHISANSVQSNSISSNTIQARHIQANAINASMISANQVNATHISANSIGASQIQANAITAIAISANAIQTQHISANTITGAQIQAGTITSVNISANSITTNLIQANAVGANQITANAITSVQISANAVQSQHISANSIYGGLIQANAIGANHITANAIQANHITANAIETQHISANTITSSQIKAGAITSNLISANAIQTQHISANTIISSQIQAGVITSNLISANAIQSQHISANTITGAMIQASTISGGNIMSNTIQTGHISANSITSNLIQANAVNATHISANSITSVAISANSIQSQHISANAIQTQHISANTITTAQIQAGAITSNLISANSITSTLITANAIQSFHISASSITSTQISANAIQSQHISANAIQTQHISANTIIGSQIQAGTITAVNIASNTITATQISANAIQGYNISANSISGNHIVAGAIQTQHISANSITSNLIQANAINATHITANAITSVAISSNSIQARHISANAIQANMISANQVNATHISSNSIQANMISANQVNATHISANSIQTQHISANTIQGNQIQANQISGNHIVAGSIDSTKLTVGTVQYGLLGQYFTYTANATNKFLTYKGSQVDQTINFNWGSGNPTLVGQADTFAIRWQGFVFAPESGTYTFVSTADDGTKLTVNNTVVINNWINNGGTPFSGNISLTAGSYYSFMFEYFENTGNSSVKLEWIRPSLTREVVPSQYLTQGNTVIDGATITTGTITASSMQVGTITAQSGILATASIQTANIADGTITSAKIGTGEIKTANIASGNITNALIANATIDYSKINSVDAGTITVGQLNGSIIKAGSITGDRISGGTITGQQIQANSIDTLQLKAGSVITSTIASGAITTDRIQAGAVTSDIIRAGSITAQHISTIGLDAQFMQVYDSKTGETLIGGGYLRVDGLDVGVVQSDNLAQNGLFLTSSSDYGFKRINPSGEALLGNTVTGVGSHQVWKIDLISGSVVKKIDIPSKKPFDVGIHPSGNYAYITVQGDNTLVQLDLAQDTLTSNKLDMGMGPARIKWRDMQMDGMDMKHFFVLNTDPDDMNIPDTLMVIDTPPSSVNGDLYVHHEIVLGNNPYDFVVDDTTKMGYITMASEGDIVVLDTTSPNSFNWKVKGRIPISAYGTDNMHGDLPSTIGLNEVLGGDSSGQYNDNSMSDMAMSGMMGTMDAMGYGASDGTLRQYSPHGIALSNDPDTLYVVDYTNGELVVVDKNGNAPYNYLVGTTAQGSFMGSPTMSGMGNMTSGGMMTGTSPASLKSNGEFAGGGPGTYYVRYRIPVGDSPEFIQVVNGKIFVTLEGSNDIAVIDESAILNEINADKAYYGTKNSDGSFSNWTTSMNMRTVTQPTVRMIMGVGFQPSFMKVIGMNLYVSLSGANQIIEIDTGMEMITKTINVGTNPKGFDITPDGRYMYVANYGGIGDLSFIYPQGPYIGDPFMALEGGIMYQGADGWTPNRSDWTYDASGNIESKSTVEFHVNEPLLNEGGYAKLTTYGTDYQFAQIEQDIVNVTNYSNGNNMVVVSGGILESQNLDNTSFVPKEADWQSSPAPHNVKIGSIVSGNTVLTSANASQYTIYYNPPQIVFSANVVGSGNWVQADYTARNDIYFKTHNTSTLIAIDNGSSPNFATNFQVDEFVPKFVAVDNRMTSSFTPTADGISDTYTGLEYSTITNRAQGMVVSSSLYGGGMDLGGGSPDMSVVVNGYEPDELAGDTTMNPVPPTNGTLSLSGNQWVQIDLGNTYMVGSVSVSHMYGADRVYHNTKTQVSEDGVVWTTIFDSAVSGEYNEKPYYHAVHNHTHYAHFINFNALPVRYVRDYANGWTSGDGHTSGNTSDWTEIKTYGDWQVEKGYVYPSNSTKAGQQIATNGIGFVSTDISKAYIAMDVQIDFTSWWYMTYIVGPEFGKIKIEMPTMMNSGHYLNQQSPYINNIAHRHIMSFPPSAMVQEDTMNSIVAGKHRVIIRQESGKVTLDRLRFEDYQYYNRSTLFIPSQTSPTIFTRYKVIAEQSKWYQGQGIQSTEGAYDTPRTNPDTGIPDKSVPIKYRIRLLSTLNPSGSVQERGTAYITSTIFETGKLSTHWRRSEASDVFSASKIEQWNPSQPHNTGIQSTHLANGSIRGTKIMANTVMDYHISNYARIQEHKLELNYPTHDHTNKSLLDSMTDWAGTSGNYGTGNTVARGDHKHDGVYLNLTGGTLTNTLIAKGINTSLESHFANGTYIDPAVGQGFGLKVSQGIATDKLNVVGNITVTGNIILTGTIDGADISNLNASVATISANVTNHIGSGNTAHPVAISGGVAGFIDGVSYAKLLNIQSSAINQATADTMYAKLSGNNLNGTTIGKSIEHGSNALILGNNDWTALTYSKTGSGIVYYNSTYRGVTISGNGTWVKIKTRLPVDPESTYFIRAKVTKHSGTGNTYIGADSLDNNYNSIATDQAQSYNYFGASGVNIPSGNSQYFEATISGYNTTSGNSPHMFDPEAKYFDLVLIGNYNDTLNGETTFEWIELYKAPNTSYVGPNLVWHAGNFSAVTLNGHVGSGGSAHALVISGGNAGFMSGADKAKLDAIQSSSINQTTADGRYYIRNQSVVSIADNSAIGIDTGSLRMGMYKKAGYGPVIAVASGTAFNVYEMNTSDLSLNVSGTALMNTVLSASSSAFTYMGNSVIHSGTFNIATLNGHIGSGGSAHAVAVSGGANGFIDGVNYAKLLNIQASAINQATADSRYLQLTGGTVTGDLKASGRMYILNGTSDSNGGLEIGRTDGVASTPYIDFHTGSGNDYDVRLIASGGLLSGNSQGSLDVRASTLTVNSNTVWNAGNFNINTLNGHIGLGGSAHAIAVSGGNAGFIDGANYGKLLNIQSNSINQATTDSLYLPLSGGALSGGLSITGNVTITGTVDGVDISSLNSSYSVTSGNVTSHIGAGGTAHAVAISGGANGFIDGVNYGKLLRIQDNAINQTTTDARYLQLNGGTLTSDLTLNGQLVINQYNAGIQFKLGAFNNSVSGSQWWHGPNGAGDNLLQIIKGGSGNSNYTWLINGTDKVWTTATLGSDPATQTWVSGNYYNTTTVDTKVASRGDVFQANANTFTNQNTFTNAGMGIKIQPSSSLANTTKLMQINNTTGVEMFSVNYSGGVNIAGDLTVTGQTRYAGTTQVNGDYYISGNLFVSGNSTLGNVSTDTTTVNGTLVVNGNVQEVGTYKEVHRRPLYGIAGDLQFQTNSTSFDSIVQNYDPTLYGNPTVQTGATRYYRLYVVYSDDINSTQVSGGQQSTLMYSANSTMSWSLPTTWGDPNNRRDWYTPYFTGLPTGHATLYAMLAQAGNNLGIRWVELIAYDKF